MYTHFSAPVRASYAAPTDEGVFDALRREAADTGDIVVLPGVFEHYYNITHQTLEILRAASMDPLATHALKVSLRDAGRFQSSPTLCEVFNGVEVLSSCRKLVIKVASLLECTVSAL